MLAGSQQRHLRAGHSGGLGIDDFDLESAAKTAAAKAREKTTARSDAHTILLCTRKGLKWTVCAGLLALRVRMTFQDIRLRLQPAFPGLIPVTGGDFLAYSCAAARDLHPLPCLHRAAKTREPKDVLKERKNCRRNLIRGQGVEVKLGAEVARLALLG